ncbi:PH domain-containing protein [Hymenobacter cellulosilyticus]|uniref:PH domain-containing protein n=1 Tax=Hymenobacter cellulosilyticus TaxID=2932248 RepID=A0A8T9Q623_9BACT|nr:PH domain-containing protein [Hymenobacter cellulosilyticus]UOQ70899.1 PH domain-containing protein [Hymenobacter cellulosilyticus]
MNTSVPVRVYQSGISPGLVLFLMVVLGGAALPMALQQTWPALLSVLAAAGFIAHVLMTTRYTITGDSLHIKSGVLYSTTLPISSIRRVAETHNLLSSPAASFDRLEIAYNRYDSVVISPREKAAFIAHLRTLNPAIEVVYQAK